MNDTVFVHFIHSNNCIFYSINCCKEQLNIMIDMFDCGRMDYENDNKAHFCLPTIKYPNNWNHSYNEHLSASMILWYFVLHI